MEEPEQVPNQEQTLHSKLNKDGPNEGKSRYPNDPAAGVGILLSPRLTKKVHSFGSHGERICWVRIKGPVCNLYIVAVYLPHRGRVMPSQDDTLKDLQECLSDIPARDCVCLVGDFNEQLQANVQGITGQWTGGQWIPTSLPQPCAPEGPADHDYHYA